MNMLNAKATDAGLELASGASIELARSGLGGGTSVLMGVRADDLVLADGDPLLRGRISVHEPLGAETLIYVDVDGTELIAKASGREPPPVGSEVGLTAAPDAIHVFDVESGRAFS